MKPRMLRKNGDGPSGSSSGSGSGSVSSCNRGLARKSLGSNGCERDLWSRWMFAVRLVRIAIANSSRSAIGGSRVQ